MHRRTIAQLVVGAMATALLAVSVLGFVVREPPAGQTGTVAGSRPGAVGIADFAFDPSPVRVPAGTTVTWTNEDGFAHTVTSDGDGPLDSGEIAAGGTYQATFDVAGTFAYLCTLHPNMRGTVEVTR